MKLLITILIICLNLILMVGGHFIIQGISDSDIYSLVFGIICSFVPIHVEISLLKDFMKNK